MSCINCGAKDHSTSACTKDRVDKTKRPCFECGKTRHIARECPEKKKLKGMIAAATAATLGSSRRAAFMGVITVDEDVRRPTPHRRTMGDFIDFRHINKFQCLDDDNNDNDEGDFCGVCECDDNNDNDEDDFCGCADDEIIGGTCKCDREGPVED